MRLLLYTATGFFIVLAGVFSFFAFQGSEHPGGAKVVLSIDSREALGAAAPAPEEQDRDLYAEAAARLKRLDAANDQSASGPENSADASNANPDANNDQPAGTPGEQDVAVSDREPATETPGASGGLDAKAESEDISALPPGTALAGLDDDKPVFRSVGQADEPADGPPGTAAAMGMLGNDLSSASVPADEQTPVAGNDRALPRTADAPAPSASDIAGLRRKQDAAANGASDAQAHQKPDVGNILAALNEREARPEAPAAAAPADSPAATAATAPNPAGSRPPMPLRRTENKTAAVGWGNTKITKADAAALKPARIAILVRGVGRDDRNSDDAVKKLPPAISLAFMPFAGGAQNWAKKAAEQGHEVIVQLPLEPTDYPNNNPGPETLLASAPPDVNTSRMNTILGRFEGYSGVTNFLGSKMLQSKTALRPILEEVKSRGLIYIGEGNTNSHALVRGLAGEVGLRYGGANVVIDAQPAPAAIQAALDKLVTIARKEGSAIGLGYASRATIEQLEAWSRSLAAQGVTLVPVGTLAQTPGAS